MCALLYCGLWLDMNINVWLVDCSSSTMSTVNVTLHLPIGWIPIPSPISRLISSNGTHYAMFYPQPWMTRDDDANAALWLVNDACSGPLIGWHSPRLPAMLLVSTSLFPINIPIMLNILVIVFLEIYFSPWELYKSQAGTVAGGNEAHI